MKKWKIALEVISILLLVACGSTSDDVPSLAPTPTSKAEGVVVSNELLMIEFTECLRNEGLEVADPIMDEDGSIQFPEILDENGVSKEEWWENCGVLLENLTLEEEKEDRSGELEYYLELAACMREEGVEVEDPTVETLDAWMGDFKTTTDFDDPDTQAVFETCTGDELWDGGDKGK
jgi:hypothetical protein